MQPLAPIQHPAFPGPERRRGPSLQERGRQDGEVLGLVGIHADTLVTVGPALARHRGYPDGEVPHGQYLSGILAGYQDGVRAYHETMEGR